MKRNGCIFLACLLTIVAVSPAQTRPSEQIAAETWARENHRAVLDRVFQDPCLASKRSREMRWVVCLRIIPGFQNELEYELSLEKRQDGSVLARAMRPRAESIYTQLCKLRTEHPNSSVSDLAKLIAVEAEAGGQNKFPMLGRVADQFEQVGIRAPLSNELMMDATEYEVRIKAAVGEHMEIVLFGPGPGAPNQPSQLVEWAESLRKLMADAF